MNLVLSYVALINSLFAAVTSGRTRVISLIAAGVSLAALWIINR